MRGPRTLAPTLDADPGKLPILSLSFPGHKWTSRLSVRIHWSRRSHDGRLEIGVGRVDLRRKVPITTAMTMTTGRKPAPGIENTSLTSLVILGCFFFSGMAGLVYEVVWTRKLTLIFGTTLHSVSAVIAIFMGGLALGSLLFGRLADRTKRPLLLYAVLEVSVGVYAALTPVIIRLIESLQIALWERYPVGVLSLSWVNILLVTAALIIPTTLMGGTLPVMTTYFVRHRETIGRHVARLYSLNTLGGAAGALIGLRADRQMRRGRRGVRELPGHKPRSAGDPGAPAGAAPSAAVIRSRRFRDRRTRRPNCPAYLIAFRSEGGKAQATHRYDRQRPPRERL